MLSAEKTLPLFPLMLTVDFDGSPVEGLTVALEIRDATTAGSYFDFADGTFKTSGWGQKSDACVELGDGRYHYLLPVASTDSLTVGKLLAAEFSFSGMFSGTSTELVEVVEMQAAVSLLRKSVTNRAEQSPGNPGSFVLYDDDDTTVILEQDLRDDSGGPVVGAVGAPARRSKTA